MSNRRSFLSKLLIAPLTLQSLRLSFATEPVRDAKWQHEYLGVEVLRLINTFQHWYQHDLRHFATMNELQTSSLIPSFLARDAENETEMGPLYMKLKLTQKEVVPGWNLQFALSENKDEYLASVTNSTDLPTSNFSTNHTGHIFYADKIGNPKRAGGVMGTVKRAAATLAGLEINQNLPFACIFCENFPCRCGLCCVCQDPDPLECKVCGCPPECDACFRIY